MKNDQPSEPVSASLRTFRDLRVWQEAMLIAESIYLLTRGFPPEERYGLSDQMRRSAVSIPSNISEGQGRTSAREFARFASIARGSTAELQTQLLLAQRLGYIPTEQTESLLERLEGVSKMLWGLHSKLRIS